MPKEVITSTDSPVDAPFEFYATVGWGRESGDVQVATHGSDGPTSSGMETGWYVTLDRDACNRMIRALRKARDQAFGQDA